MLESVRNQLPIPLFSPRSSVTPSVVSSERSPSEEDIELAELSEVAADEVVEDKVLSVGTDDDLEGPTPGVTFDAAGADVGLGDVVGEEEVGSALTGEGEAVVSLVLCLLLLK